MGPILRPLCQIVSIVQFYCEFIVTPSWEKFWCEEELSKRFQENFSKKATSYKKNELWKNCAIGTSHTITFFTHINLAKYDVFLLASRSSPSVHWPPLLWPVRFPSNSYSRSSLTAPKRGACWLQRNVPTSWSHPYRPTVFSFLSQKNNNKRCNVSIPPETLWCRQLVDVR